MLQYVKCLAVGFIDIAVYKITAPMFLLNSLTSHDYCVYESLLYGEQADANPVRENNSIAMLMLIIDIIYSRSAVFISTFSSKKPELFLKKGGVILSV